VMAISRYYPKIVLERLKKTPKILSQDSNLWTKKVQMEVITRKIT
jgi:hypothetical protein